MMRVWVINPNTTQAMTDKIADCARAVVGSQVTVTGVTSEIGPASIESYYDEALSVPGVLRAVQRGEREGVDGYVIACFGDPGIDAAREVATGPVIGIAEAAMQAASHLGTGFSIVTTLSRTIGQSAHLAERYGMRRFCRGIHACEIPVLDLDTDPNARKIITESCREAIEVDRSDVVVLGCAGMADMCGEISAELGVPVVDGVTAATLTVQSLITMGLRTSKRGEYATPPAKRYSAG
ncbi:aspartate/glutamate racemase family protein [Mycobacterium sp. shizuoka-1]|uniref:aspartate/glutamate racemase family protein n=1 Tax=Mycobacterium sp. shizuoka-1 TaxID=2039281 RepID=UPI0018EDA950|nr:aspartate/glutamate racemase family protein [Mycobacterium sp. shizuoka-1]